MAVLDVSLLRQHTADGALTFRLRRLLLPSQVRYGMWAALVTDEHFQKIHEVRLVAPGQFELIAHDAKWDRSAGITTLRCAHDHFVWCVEEQVRVLPRLGAVRPPPAVPPRKVRAG